MENQKPEDFKIRGRKKQTKSQGSEDPKSTNQTQGMGGVHTSDETTSVEGKEIELGVDLEALMAHQSIYDTVGHLIAPKYPKYHFAFVNREDAQNQNAGWKYLKLVKGKTDVEVTDNIDEAYKTHWNVLCWRDKRIQDYVDKQIRLKNEAMNRSIQNESVKDQVRALNGNLKEISPEVGARPLGLQDL